MYTLELARRERRRAAPRGSQVARAPPHADLRPVPIHSPCDALPTDRRSSRIEPPRSVRSCGGQSSAARRRLVAWPVLLARVSQRLVVNTLRWRADLALPGLELALPLRKTPSLLVRPVQPSQEHGVIVGRRGALRHGRTRRPQRGTSTAWATSHQPRTDPMTGASKMSSTQTTFGRLRISRSSVWMQSMMQEIVAASTASASRTRGTVYSFRERRTTDRQRTFSDRSAQGEAQSPAYEWKPVRRRFTPMKLNSIVRVADQRDDRTPT